MWSISNCRPALFMRAYARRTLLSTLALLATGCTEPTQPKPSPSSPPPVPITPAAPTPTGPTITGAAVLYRRVSPLSYGSADAYLLSSGADSAFTIIFPDGGTSWAWSGRYERADSLLVFHYNAWSAAGELGARGTIRGDTLLLKYNVIMQLTDFEDGIYVRAPQ